MPGRQQHHARCRPARRSPPRTGRRRPSRPGSRRSRPRPAPGSPAARPRRARPGGRGWPWSGCRRRGRRRASDIRTRSPSSAPPENGEDGSTASTPTRLPALRYAVTSAEVEVDLPTPGEPVSPTTYASPVSGASAAITSRSCGDAPSTREISRATARGRPSRASATRVATSTASTQLRSAHDPPVQTGYGDRRPRRPQPLGTRTISASPWPPPPHSAAAPMPPPRRFSSSARCSTSRAPDMPIG